MSRLGRNDPCPCGSGKKFKKCCGLDNVIAFHPRLYEEELEKLVDELIDFMDNTFGDEMMQFAVDHLPNEMLVQEDEADFSTIISLFYGWAIFHLPVAQGKTIFSHFHDQTYPTITYPSVREKFFEWNRSVTGVFEVHLSDDVVDEERFVLEDAQTFDLYPYVGPLDSMEDGDILVGTIIPFMDGYSFFLGALPIVPTHVDLTFDAVDELTDRGEFVHDQFPEFFATILQVSPEEIIGQLEWTDQNDQQVALLFAAHMVEKEYDSFVIQTAIILWNYYCKEESPVIQTTGAYAATVDYFVQKNFFEGPTDTQTELAKEYRVHAGSISSNFQKIKEPMESALDQLADADFNDGSER